VPKIDYQKDVVQGSVRVRYSFDSGETGQLNYPLGVSDQQVEEDLKRLYEQVQAEKEQPTTSITKQLVW